MPTTAIPQTDPALLQAQATAGQAGVLAYQAAKEEMAKARTNAVSDALTAAQNRGAPQGAMTAAMGEANQMYDRRDAALITGQASQEADLANRAGRMASYNGAVEQARGLIGDQVTQAVAPIDARTRFSVAGIEAQGRANVDEIEAKRRLKELEMEAAFLAAQAKGGGGGGRGGGGGGGGGKGGSKGTPNASELKAMLTQRAIPKVEKAFQAAAGSIKGNVAHGQSQVRQLQGVSSNAAAKAKAAQAIVQSSRPVSLSRSETARTPVRPTPARTTPYPTGDPETGLPLNFTSILSKMHPPDRRPAGNALTERQPLGAIPSFRAGRSGVTPERWYDGRQESYVPNVGSMGGRTSSGSFLMGQTPIAPPVWAREGLPGPPVAQRASMLTRNALPANWTAINDAMDGKAQAARVVSAQQRAQNVASANLLPTDPTKRAAAIDAARREQVGMQRQMRNMEAETRDAISQEHGAVRQGLMDLWDPEQNPGMADIYTPVFNAGVPTTARQLEEQMLGSENGPGMSPEVIRQAMIQSAGELVDEGYKIDEPALNLALDYDAGYKLGDSYYDTFGKMSGYGDLDQQAAKDRTAINNQRADSRWDRENLQNNREDMTFAQGQEDRERRITAAETALTEARTKKERDDALKVYSDELQAQGIVPQRLTGVDPDVQYGVAEGGDNFQSWNEGKQLVEEFRDAISEDTGKPYEWDDVRNELVTRGRMTPASNVNDQILLDLLEQYW